MTIIGDVFKELFKMFVADLRLTLAVVGGVTLVATFMGSGGLGPVGAGLTLAIGCVLVLGEAVLREARKRK
ncbi:hypothetical protein B6V73_19245 [Thioclava sp. JM3]|uniref:Uncharacterized protein n=1 Tax=Thioclava nitratireducens TaxID=1915078 RepID=A0ABN4XFQ0_9RHOB|nr:MULTISPECIES: hypothetical protein [Thioclava]AQS50115.1 hypothetical protein BMG03_19575 [Thioclava nitratireducens]OWY10421.1 hypothetical protein B6V73_19245 [Thioclava sp. JM3]